MSANSIEYPVVPTLKNDLVQATEEYLLNSLKEINVTFPNMHELSDFLVRHFAIVNPLLEVCKYARKELGNDVTLKLVLKTELEDNSGFQSITLFIGDKNYPDDFSDKIAQIKQPYRQYFREAEILFTCQPDYSI